MVLNPDITPKLTIVGARLHANVPLQVHKSKICRLMSLTVINLP